MVFWYWPLRQSSETHDFFHKNLRWEGQWWASVSASWFYVAVSARLVGLSVPCDDIGPHGVHPTDPMGPPKLGDLWSAWALRFSTPFRNSNPHQIGQDNSTSKALALESTWLESVSDHRLRMSSTEAPATEISDWFMDFSLFSCQAWALGNKVLHTWNVTNWFRRLVDIMWWLIFIFGVPELRLPKCSNIFFSDP